MSPNPGSIHPHIRPPVQTHAREASTFSAPHNKGYATSDSITSIGPARQSDFSAHGAREAVEAVGAFAAVVLSFAAAFYGTGLLLGAGAVAITARVSGRSGKVMGALSGLGTGLNYGASAAKSLATGLFYMVTVPMYWSYQLGNWVVTQLLPSTAKLMGEWLLQMGEVILRLAQAIAENAVILAAKARKLLARGLAGARRMLAPVGRLIALVLRASMRLMHIGANAIFALALQVYQIASDCIVLLVKKFNVVVTRVLEGVARAWKVLGPAVNAALDAVRDGVLALYGVCEPYLAVAWNLLGNVAARVKEGAVIVVRKGGGLALQVAKKGVQVAKAVADSTVVAAVWAAHKVVDATTVALAWITPVAQHVREGAERLARVVVRAAQSMLTYAMRTINAAGRIAERLFTMVQTTAQWTYQKVAAIIAPVFKSAADLAYRLSLWMGQQVRTGAQVTAAVAAAAWRLFKRLASRAQTTVAATAARLSKSMKAASVVARSFFSSTFATIRLSHQRVMAWLRRALAAA